LSPVLETGASKVFLHHRDFPTGAPVPETATVVFDSAERTVVVLSESFIHSELQKFRAILFKNDLNKDKILFLLVPILQNFFFVSADPAK
jgi:hypothetical protein